jgi:predicted metalloprotease
MRSIKQTISRAAAVGALALGAFGAGPAAAAPHAGADPGFVPPGTSVAQALPGTAVHRVAASGASYAQRVTKLIGLIDGYYGGQLGTAYVKPAVHAPYDIDASAGVCGGVAADAGNAFYCGPGAFITWDESGLLRPLFDQIGDGAVGFVLAHEWGHAMQDELRIFDADSIHIELQADCFAGSWLDAMEREGSLLPADLDEATAAVSAFGDPPGTPSDDPQAHGSGAQRLAAAQFGLDRGMQACIDSVESLPNL